MPILHKRFLRAVIIRPTEMPNTTQAALHKLQQSKVIFQETVATY